MFPFSDLSIAKREKSDVLQKERGLRKPNVLSALSHMHAFIPNRKKKSCEGVGLKLKSKTEREAEARMKLKALIWKKQN